MSGSFPKNAGYRRISSQSKDDLAKFLGGGYQVEASIGHIRDLPGGKKRFRRSSSRSHGRTLGERRR